MASLSLQVISLSTHFCQGKSIALKPGDLVVLSNLGDLFSWRFHLGENSSSRSHLKRVGFQVEEGGEDQPSSKRQKVGLDLEASGRTRGQGEGSASRELIHILQKKKEAAEVRLKNHFIFYSFSIWADQVRSDETSCSGCFKGGKEEA